MGKINQQSKRTQRLLPPIQEISCSYFSELKRLFCKKSAKLIKKHRSYRQKIKLNLKNFNNFLGSKILLTLIGLNRFIFSCSYFMIHYLRYTLHTFVIFLS